MLRCRLLKAGDDLSPVLPFLTGEYDDKKDTVMVAVDENDKVQAVLLSRPVCLVHGCWLGPEVGISRRRSILERLIDYGLGYIKALGAKDAVFITDHNNDRFRGLIANRGGFHEVDGQISYLEVL